MWLMAACDEYLHREARNVSDGMFEAGGVVIWNVWEQYKYTTHLEAGAAWVRAYEIQ